MNKLLYSIMAMGFLLLFSSISYAATTNNTGGGGTITLGITKTTTVTLSSGVYANYQGTATTGVAYGIATVNDKGVNVYGLSSASSQIYYQPTKVGTPGVPTTADVTAGQSTWTSTWTAMGQ